jgi:hypothetical protein
MAASSATTERAVGGREGRDYQERQERQQDRQDLQRRQQEIKDIMADDGWHSFDPTDNTLQWCRHRHNPQLVLLRSSFDHDPRRVTIVTVGQLRSAVRDGDTDPGVRDLLNL